MSLYSSTNPRVWEKLVEALFWPFQWNLTPLIRREHASSDPAFACAIKLSAKKIWDAGDGNARNARLLICWNEFARLIQEVCCWFGILQHIVNLVWHNLWGYRWAQQVLKSYRKARNLKFVRQKCRNYAFSRQKWFFYFYDKMSWYDMIYRDRMTKIAIGSYSVLSIAFLFYR